ncbi:hypothetical protein [Klebsiella michiganensis]|uniref:hypothetical protein n=1 Tax=Klebsiella michiganensis TaxID=1134687 RepID=UPI000A2D3123|nr:hypothetical protein [Klebsiella michiganensis]OSY90503.1 hypothetical protein BM280_24330 [Klebsiella michiganensis]
MVNFIQNFINSNKIKKILGSYGDAKTKFTQGKISALNRLEMALKQINNREHITFSRDCYKNVQFRKLINLYSFSNKYFISTTLEKDVPTSFILFTFLEFYKDNINHFHEFDDYKMRIENFFVTKEYSECYNLLNEVKEKFGESIWYYDVLMAINVASGAKIIKEDFVVKDFPRIFHITNHLFEKHTSISSLSYKQKIKIDTLDRLRKQYTNYADFISFILQPTNLDPDIDLYNVLQFSQRLFPIDKYQIIKRCLLEVITMNIVTQEETTHDIRQFIEEISVIEKGTYWKKLHNSMNFKFEVIVKNNESIILERYSQGDYDETITLCESSLLDNPSNFTTLEIYARSLLFENSTKLREVLTRPADDLMNLLLINLINAYRNPSSYYSAIEAVEDLKFRYLCFDFIIPILPSFYASYPYQNTEKLKLSLISVCNSEYCFTPKNKARLDNLLSNRHLINNDIFEDKNYLFSESRNLRLQLSNEVNNGNINKELILKLLEKINALQDLTPPDKCYIIASTLFKIKEYNLLIRRIVDSALINSSSLILFPVLELAYLLDEDVEIAADSLNAAIFSHFIFRHIDKDYIGNVSYFVDRYLENFKAVKPSDIFYLKNEITSKELFLLKNVCVEDILSGLENIDIILLMLTERIKILNILIEKRVIFKLNDDEVISLNNEEGKIYSKLLVNKLTKHHLSNLIHIDFNGIFLAKTDFYKLAYETVRKIHLDDLSIHIDYYISSNNSNDAESLNTIDVKSGDEAKLYHYGIIYSNMINDFIMNSEYGLVRYLSSEFRHGVLPNQIRSVFEADSLVTLKISDNTYEEPTFWLTKISNIDTNEKKHLNSCIQEFSNKIDSFIVDTNDLLIPIISNKESILENKTTSGFIFSATTEKYNELMKFMNNMIEATGNNNFSYEDFKESIEEFIWRQLDHCFLVMKTIINEAVKPNFRAECDKLLSALSKNNKIIENGLISEKIQLAKFNISEKLSDIENWFRRPSKELDEDIELATLLIASKDYIEGIYSPQKIKIELRNNEHDSLKLSNASLLNLTRSLVTMYNNCLRHGIDLVGTPISVTTTVIDSQLTISVENEISYDKRLELFKRNITDEVDSYPNNDYSDRLKMEGGTGLYKVFKNIQDGFKNSRFTVELNDDTFKQIIVINLE